MLGCVVAGPGCESVAGRCSCGLVGDRLSSRESRFNVATGARNFQLRGWVGRARVRQRRLLPPGARRREADVAGAQLGGGQRDVRRCLVCRAACACRRDRPPRAGGGSGAQRARRGTGGLGVQPPVRARWSNQPAAATIARHHAARGIGLGVHRKRRLRVLQTVFLVPLAGSVPRGVVNLVSAVAGLERVARHRASLSRRQVSWVSPALRGGVGLRGGASVV